MQEITANLGSLSWWFTAVLVAIVINIVSKYATTGTDRILSKVSQQWTQRSKQSQSAFQAKVELCILKPFEMQLAISEEMRLRSQAIYSLLFGLTLMLIPALISWPTPSPVMTGDTGNSLLYVVMSSLLRVTGAVMVLVSVRLDSKADSVERVCTLALKSMARATVKHASVESSAVDA